ncbi:heme-binding protein [Nocardia sp. CA2R105]|uniref:hemophore-related protein n=1 Tax=Nocardia coffeae TaxID=2873381 RepID=UPI001CA661E3|nr:hemophore-related protein [Nocardia coffeae]MBY8862600.1 heme-binding protein [Nocardia coffeae]
MKRIAAALLTATAGLATLAIALPATASADPAQCTVQNRAAAHAAAAPKVAAYLAAHPDLSAELAHIRTLPKDQRKAERQSYRQAHPDLIAGLRGARQPVIDYRHACHR